MINWFKLAINHLVNEASRFAQETKEMARIEITPEGRALLLNGSTQVAEYARKRDAVRGAARRGLVLG